MGGRAGKSRKRLLIGSALGVGALAAPALFLPVNRRPLVYCPPVKQLPYDEAISQFRFRASASPDGIRPECADHLLEHGLPTEHVFVLLHGLSNCPAQFGKLGRQLFERGHNVVIPRLPYHGEKNSLASDWARLTAAEMLEAGNYGVNLARSLGGKVTIAGLSANGATVAWMAQNRSDLDRAVLLAPFSRPHDCQVGLWRRLNACSFGYPTCLCGGIPS